MAAHGVAVPRRCRLSLTLRQMTKLVVFAAVASACLAAGVQHAEMFPQAWFGTLMTEAVVVPLMLAVTTFPLVRQGPQKDWLIRALLMVAIAMAWSDAFIYLGRAILLLTRGQHFYEFSWILTLATVIILPGPLAWLFWTCLPGKCPHCRRSSLLRYSSGQPRFGMSGNPIYQCLCCEGRYRKRERNWEPLAPGTFPAIGDVSEVLNP
jgi:hypothetical protein